METKKLSEIFKSFEDKKAYQELDLRALDLSRSAAAGNFSDLEYSDWSSLTNDPLVVVNLVRTFITTIASRLSNSPLTPVDEVLKNVGEMEKLNLIFTESYIDALSDGYGFISVGLDENGISVKPVNSRYILFNGREPTLKDATDVLVFEIVDKTDEEIKENLPSIANNDFTEFDEHCEKVTIHRFFKAEDGLFYYSTYSNLHEEPLEESPIPINCDRIPIVRLYGQKVELSDKKPHYRGLYYLTSSVFKAMTLSATKIQIRTSMEEDANFLASAASVANHRRSWDNSGVKTYDAVDGNGRPIAAPSQIAKDSRFLIESFNTWKTVLVEMIGQVAQSSQDAITESEVVARNEARDAIANDYLSKVAVSISEVYRVIQQLLGLGNKPVVIVGGFLEQVKRKKQYEELSGLYALAKESGLNTQGFIYEFLKLTEIEDQTKASLARTFETDPFASPLTKQLKAQIEELKKMSSEKDHTISILRVQASQRLERQDNYVKMVERTRRMEMAFKQWQQETKDTQAARMEVLKTALQGGDTMTALFTLQSIEQTDPLIALEQSVQQFLKESQQNYIPVEQQVGKIETPAENLV